MQGEPTQGQHAKAETRQGAIGSPMEASKPRRASFNLATRQGTLEELESSLALAWLGAGSAGERCLGGCLVGGKRGNQNWELALRK